MRLPLKYTVSVRIARNDFESRDYYQYRLYEAVQRSQVDSYLNIRQNGRLLIDLLFPDLVVWAKIEFARSCAAHDGHDGHDG